MKAFKDFLHKLQIDEEEEAKKVKNKYFQKYWSGLNLHLGSDNGYNYMNHGYYPPYKNLFDYHETFKHQASLYLHLFDDIDTTNKSLLEVGCGRGGGISLLSKMFDFKNVEACDLSEANINHCQKHADGIKFKVADAENLDYENNQFDIVINVESSCYYQEPERFYSKVQELLKPNGVFLYADLFDEHFLQWQYAEDRLPLYFKNIKKENITNNVIQACDRDIVYFDKVIPDEDIKETFIDIAKGKGEYYKKGELFYLKYVCN
jgi:SAM-dependent methyltransferase